MKRKVKMNWLKPEPLFTLENGIGLILAILIIFDLKVERELSLLLNTPLGILSSGLVTILLFISLNPIVGILFLIYLYDTIQTSKLSTIIKDAKLGVYNPTPDTELEETVIQNNKPIIHAGEGNNVSFQPFMTTNVELAHTYGY
jgi:hypothetical protein